MAVKLSSGLKVLGGDVIRNPGHWIPYISAPEIISAVADTSVDNGNIGVTQTCGAVAAGDLIVVISAFTNNAGTLNTPTASGLTFTQIAKTASTDPDIGVWYAVSPDATSRSITTTGTAASTTINYAAVIVLRGANNADPVDATDSDSSAFTATTTPSVSGVASTSSGSLVFAAFVASGYPSYTSAPSSDETNGWSETVAVYENTWGGLCVASKPGLSPGSATFTQPSASGVSISFSIAGD